MEKGRNDTGTRRNGETVIRGHKTKDRRRKTEGLLSVVRGPWSVANKA